MITQLLKRKNLSFERSYPAPIDVVWRACTDADMLRQWWGPEKTLIPECEVEAREGGRLYVVTQAGEEMGKYAGTRWPMEGTITHFEPPTRLVVEARSWTEGDDGSIIHHTNDLTLSEVDGATDLRLQVSISQIGPKAKMAAFGMKWGYKAQLDALAELLTSP